MKKNQFQGFTFDLIRKMTVQILQSLMFLEAVLLSGLLSTG
jgi:hypothetical protein